MDRAHTAKGELLRLPHGQLLSSHTWLPSGGEHCPFESVHGEESVRPAARQQSTPLQRNRQILEQLAVVGSLLAEKSGR